MSVQICREHKTLHKIDSVEVKLMKKYIYIVILVFIVLINGCSSNRSTSNDIENANQNSINNTNKENTKENSTDVHLEQKELSAITSNEIEWDKYVGNWISTSGYDAIYAYENGGIILKLENCNEKEIKGYMTVVAISMNYCIE